MLEKGLLGAFFWGKFFWTGLNTLPGLAWRALQIALKDYIMQGALDKLDVIECFEEPGRKWGCSAFLVVSRREYSG